MGVWAIRFLGSVFVTAHMICSSMSSSQRCCSSRYFVYILLFAIFPTTHDVVLLPDDRLRDYMTYIFLHQLNTATSNKHTRCLM
jgi:hypothetical protein